MVYPHYLAPTPSMAVVELQPDLDEGDSPRASTSPGTRCCVAPSARASRPPASTAPGTRSGSGPWS
jgi:type VI protein secretion system component VasA